MWVGLGETLDVCVLLGVALEVLVSEGVAETVSGRFLTGKPLGGFNGQTPNVSNLQQSRGWINMSR